MNCSSPGSLQHGAPIERLLRLQQKLSAGALTLDDQRWLAASGLNIIAALAPPPAPGQRTPATTIALSRRDELVRAAVANYFPGRSMNLAAVELHQALARYAATGWQHDRTSTECPPRCRGTLREACWRILMTRPCVPSARSLRSKLATSSGYSLPIEQSRM